MKLSFIQQHLSISQFHPIELPDFMVLTGVNGSGKSHLLEAIERRYVVIEGLNNPTIVRFNYETFKLENEGAYNAQSITSEIESAWNYFENQIKPTVNSYRNSLGEKYQDLLNECTTNNRSLWSVKDNEALTAYKENLHSFFSQPNIKGNPQSVGISSLAKKLTFSIDEIDRTNFINLYKPFNFKNDFLPQELGKVVWDYYIKFRSNQVNNFENSVHGKDYPVLSEDDFISAHGQKPWDVINNILGSFSSLDYVVSSPEGSNIFGNYQLKLIHTKKANLEIDFSSLSSGERVLMALVASIYKASSDRHFPDILLLDELDASLHPSMMKNMLSVIKSVFLDHGIKVILVTHSPTTIALAPESSIFLMNREGLNRIEKSSPQKALTILTEGFATLDEGIMIFDQAIKSSLSIITEGKNTLLIKKALSLYEINDVEVINGFEDSSGKDQLKTLFHFFKKANIKSKVLFVWDCDVAFTLQEQNNAYAYFLPKNQFNNIASRGIENMFPEELFENFTNITINSKKIELKEFDNTRKNDFLEFILQRNEKTDFKNFQYLFEKLEEIKNI